MTTTSKTRHAVPLCGALWLLGAPALAAPSLRTVTDVWGGNGNGSIAQGCTTYAPIPDLSAFFNGGGFRVLGGNVACGYTGVTADQSAGSGPLLTQQTLPPVPLDANGGSYAGAAAARAAYGALGVATHSVLVGTTGSLTAAVSTGAAFWQDTLSAASPAAATGTAGFVRYVFEVDGHLSTSGPMAGTASVQLNLRHGSGPVLGLATLAAQGAEMGRVSAVDGNGGFALGPGSVAGAGLFGSTLHVPFFGDVDLPITWGTPWEVTVGLMAMTGRSADASFLSTARLVDLQFFDAAHQRIGDVALSAASGTDYLNSSPVPEPQAGALWALGLAVLAWARGRVR